MVKAIHNVAQAKREIIKQKKVIKIAQEKIKDLREYLVYRGEKPNG